MQYSNYNIIVLYLNPDSEGGIPSEISYPDPESTQRCKSIETYTLREYMLWECPEYDILREHI